MKLKLLSRWEPAAGLQACKRLLSSFWKGIEDGEKEYLQGQVVKPSEEWIGEYYL